MTVDTSESTAKHHAIWRLRIYPISIKKHRVSFWTSGQETMNNGLGSLALVFVFERSILEFGIGCLV